MLLGNFLQQSPTSSYFLMPSLVSGISVSSKNDGVFVLHVPIDEKADKVCLKYYLFDVRTHFVSAVHTPKSVLNRTCSKRGKNEEVAHSRAAGECVSDVFTTF